MDYKGIIKYENKNFLQVEICAYTRCVFKKIAQWERQMFSFSFHLQRKEKLIIFGNQLCPLLFFFFLFIIRFWSISGSMVHDTHFRLHISFLVPLSVILTSFWVSNNTDFQVSLPLGLLRRAEAYLGEYFSQKPRYSESCPYNSFSRCSSSSSIATEEGLFEQPEPPASSKSVIEKVLARRSLQLHEKQQAWQVGSTFDMRSHVLLFCSHVSILYFIGP